jgi:hypothetical protein
MIGKYDRYRSLKFEWGNAYYNSLYLEQRIIEFDFEVKITYLYSTQEGSLSIQSFTMVSACEQVIKILG